MLIELDIRDTVDWLIWDVIQVQNISPGQYQKIVKNRIFNIVCAKS